MDRSAVAWLQTGVILSNNNNTYVNILDQYVSEVQYFYMDSDTPLAEIVVEGPYILDAIEATFETRSTLREDCKTEFSATYSILHSLLLGSPNQYAVDHVEDKR